MAEITEVDIVSVFRSKPATRWLVPSAAAVVIIGGGAAAGTIVANAQPSLPERSAAQLLVDLQTAQVDGFSGTIVQSADLGLPSLSGLTGGTSGAPTGLADLAGLISGSNTARVWYAGQTQSRLALVGASGETDVIRNGGDVWLWRSSDNSATHLTLPAGQEQHESAMPGIASTPQEAADAALRAIEPSTTVTTTGAAKVAGRDAYELVLAPKDTASLVGQVRLAIDAQEHIPLRVDVYAKDATSPAVRVAFQQISFVKPDAQQFVFNPPAGAKVTTHSAPDAGKVSPAEAAKRKAANMAHQREAAKARPAGAAGPKVIGQGWTSVVTLTLPADKKNAGKNTPSAEQENAVLGLMEKVSGSWGSGHVFAGKLFSVLLTDDGRVFAGAVAPESLYQAAATK